MMLGRTIQVLSLVAVTACSAACDSVPLVAPTRSTLTLVAGASIVPVGGSTSVTAHVVEPAGTPVHDGTVVTFSASLGTIHPAEVATVRGRARATFTAGAASGVADLRAFSGDAATETVKVTIGAAAVGAIRMTAQPTSLPPSGGAATVTATVLDSAQNPLPRVPVTFRSSAGILQHSSATTDGGGNARTVLNTAATAVVTATAGDDVQATTTITVDPVTSINITAAPPMPVAGQVVTVTVTPPTTGPGISNVLIDFGDGTRESLGALTGTTTVTHLYERAGSYVVRATAHDTAERQSEASIGVTVSDE